MTCHSCRALCKRFGKHRNGLQRYRCNQCRRTYTEDHQRPLDEMRLPVEKAEAVLRLLLEGMSIRSAERVTGVYRNTIFRLLVLAGERCQRLMDEKLVDLPARDVQCDEIWGFVGKKEGHKSALEEAAAEIGDAYCYIAIERHTKLVLCHYLGKRLAVHPCDPFCAADAHPFQQQFKHAQSAVQRHAHGVQRPLVIFRICPIALLAAEPLQTIPMLAVALAHTPARMACHNLPS